MTHPTPEVPGYGTGPTFHPAAGSAPQPTLWLIFSALIVVLCCNPLGIVGIVYAAQAQDSLTAGDLVTATEKTAKAKTWTIIAGVSGVVFSVLFYGVMVAAMFATSPGVY